MFRLRNQNSRRGKLAFELQMIEGHRPCILAAESDADLEAWMDIINKALNRSEVASRKSIALSESSSSTPPSTPKCGTLRSLELKNPELQKYTRETDFSIAQLRKESRVNVSTKPRQ